MKYELTEKVAIVTGAAGGMGATIATELASRGAHVAAVDVAECGDDRVGYYRCDISDHDQVARLCSSIRRDFGGIDIVINCAGLVGRRDPSLKDPIEARQFYLDETYDEWLRVMKVNVWGAVTMVRHAFPFMVERGGGSIVTISSLAGRFGAAAAALSYTASKAALIGLSKQWAKMFGRNGIRSNLIAPGPTRTPMIRSMPTETVEQFQAATMTGRISESYDIAAAVSFLASDASANITGTVVDINGGCWMPA